MLNIHEFTILVSGIISGIILFQSAIVAPSVFKTLNADQASPFLRSVFPKLFRLVAILGALALITTLFFNLFK